MFNAIIDFISQYISYWPFVAFFALVLAGVNIPISEDAIIVLSAGFAQADHSLTLPNYVAIYFGIIISDMISYWFGRLLSKGVLKIKFFQKKLTPENINWVSRHLEQHGYITFQVCRFIPFGVRNALFMGSGFVGLPFRKFIFFDFLAALVSSSVLYFLVYFIGKTANTTLKIVGIVLLALLAIGILMAAKRLKHEVNTESSDWNGED